MRRVFHRSSLLMWAPPLLACLLLAAAIMRSRGTEGEFRSAATRAEETARVVRHLANLRERRQWVSVGVRRTDDVIASAKQSLRLAGLGDRFLTEVRPESDAPLPGYSDAANASLRLQTVAITLRGITMAQLGVFLVAWTEQSPAWRVTRLSTTPTAGATRTPQRDSERSSITGTFDVLISVSAVYMEDGSP